MPIDGKITEVTMKRELIDSWAMALINLLQWLEDYGYEAKKKCRQDMLNPVILIIVVLCKNSNCLFSSLVRGNINTCFFFLQIISGQFCTMNGWLKADVSSVSYLMLCSTLFKFSGVILFFIEYLLAGSYLYHQLLATICVTKCYACLRKHKFYHSCCIDSSHQSFMAF